MIINELHNSLLVHEQRMNIEKEEEQVSKVATETSYRGRGKGGYRGRGRALINRSTVECYKCHKIGHFKYECPDWEKDANYVELDETEEMVLMAHVEENHATRDQAWFLDSGCSNHMSGDKRWFCNLDEEYHHSVKHTLFVKSDDKGNTLIVSLHVDDLIVVGSSLSMVEDFKTSMKNEFDMTDLAEMRYFLGVKVIQDSLGIFISQ